MDDTVWIQGGTVGARFGLGVWNGYLDEQAHIPYNMKCNTIQ